MNELEGVLELHEVDQMLALARGEVSAPAWGRLGFAFTGAASLERERARLADGVAMRWRPLYERSLHRYGRGLYAVRERVCLGCFVTLPTAAAPPPGEAQLHLCQGCGRLLLWS